MGEDKLMKSICEEHGEQLQRGNSRYRVMNVYSPDMNHVIKEDERIKLRDLTPNHITNILKHLKKMVKDNYELAYYQELYNLELLRRSDPIGFQRRRMMTEQDLSY